MPFLRAACARICPFLLAALTANAPVAQDPDFADQEETDWQRALSEGSAAAFQRYLEVHPVGRHAGEAFGVWLMAISAPAASSCRHIIKRSQ